MNTQLNPVIMNAATENNTTHHRSFTPRERIEIGCAFNLRVASAKELAFKYGCDLSYIYLMGKEAELFLDTYAKQDDYAGATGLIPVTKKFVEFAAICLRVVCQASLEDTARYINMVYCYPISVSTVSNICLRYGETALEWNKSVPLDNISVGANDEIFFGHKQRQMILAGVDLKTEYIYGAAISDDRKAETWEQEMRGFREQGLSLVVSISDAGASLIKGVSDAFDGKCFSQLDVFHTLRDLGDPVFKLETKAYSLIGEQARLQQVLTGPKPHQKTKDSFAVLSQEMNSILMMVDTVKTLYSWVQELLNFSGYSRFETENLLRWIVEELKAAVLIGKPLTNISVHRLSHAISTFEGRISKSLSFIDYLVLTLAATAEELGIAPEALRLAYRIRSMAPFSEEYMFMYERIQRLLHGTGISFDSLSETVERIVKNSERASSMIENVNSRLRTALNDSRGMTRHYLALLIMYLNTKSLRRSDVTGRKGKSPYEMLTGEKISIIDILFPGFEWIRPLWKAVKRSKAA